jgi:hypothetical protein
VTSRTSGDAQSPAPASGVGADDTGLPQGNTAPRDLPWFLARTPPSDGTPPPRTASEWNRQSVAAFIANHSPKETPDA